MQRYYPNLSSTVDFYFTQNEDDFIVDEQPIRFKNQGNFLVLKVVKKNQNTWDLIEKIANFLKCYPNEIGYAGLKDKHATTTQYISIPKKYAKDIKKYNHKKIQIVDTCLHNEKISIGDLRGNRFTINLHEVTFEKLNILEKRLKLISKNGMPNYFGYQRFGNDKEENLEKAKKIINGELIVKERKIQKMIISAYQSDFFNRWLAGRLKTSKDSNFKLIDGDVFLDHKSQKYFTPNNINKKIQDEFDRKNISVTGLLCGRKVFRAIGKARKIEEKYDDMFMQEKGYRREAIVYPKNISTRYKKEDEKLTISFELPKGSYATVLLENLANRELR
ncbi:MAG: tRNA pseudouridine(13) synthase TruD [Sulfurovum sp.]